MLVLTRKKGETIFIGEDIRIVLLEMKNKQARIGIACPNYLHVMRGELGARTKQEPWPNLTPDEVVYLKFRFEELSEWWTLPNATTKKKEFKDLDAFLYQLQRWAFDEWLDWYSHWFKK